MPLTTIRMPLFALGAAAISRARASGRRRRAVRPRDRRRLPELVVRASTGAPVPGHAADRMRIRAAVFTAPNRPLEVAERRARPRRAATRCSCASRRRGSAAATSPTSTASGPCRCRSCSGTRAPARSRRSARASTRRASASASCSRSRPPAAPAASASRAARTSASTPRRASTRVSCATARRRLSRDGERVYHLAYVSSFASHAVVPANGALPIDPRLDLDLACLLGCGVTTGVMSVTRRANVRPGDASRSSPAAAWGSRP